MLDVLETNLVVPGSLQSLLVSFKLISVSLLGFEKTATENLFICFYFTEELVQVPP